MLKLSAWLRGLSALSLSHYPPGSLAPFSASLSTTDQPRVAPPPHSLAPLDGPAAVGPSSTSSTPLSLTASAAPPDVAAPPQLPDEEPPTLLPRPPSPPSLGTFPSSPPAVACKAAASPSHPQDANVGASRRSGTVDVPPLVLPAHSPAALPHMTARASETEAAQPPALQADDRKIVSQESGTTAGL